MIFQYPYASLNPRWTVGRIIAELLHTFGFVTGRAQAREQVSVLLTRVGLTPKDAEKFPHEFSGGQRQRILIARAHQIENLRLNRHVQREGGFVADGE